MDEGLALSGLPVAILGFEDFELQAVGPKPAPGERLEQDRFISRIAQTLGRKIDGELRRQPLAFEVAAIGTGLLQPLLEQLQHFGRPQRREEALWGNQLAIVTPQARQGFDLA
ncbi:hypothetical protein GALL_431710 [mine drainage metagenome]|uniref:Uncharacterized protein n=1 Tax=mine drainage metagenome TaxID=410659 RepID=A0A1J5Q5J7_9ZZZZ